MSDPVFAVLGLFPSADALVKAIPAVKEGKPGRLEAYTPYPVHGLDEALGLRRSPLGGMVMVAGTLGALVAIGMQVWMSAVDYPIVTGGKAPGSWEAFIPVMFEVMVLFATFTAGLGMLFLLNRLPFFGHPVLRSRAITGITRDRFALSIEAEGEAFDVDRARAALETAGAEDIELLTEPAPAPFLTSQAVLRSLGAVLAACAFAGFVTYWAVKLFPVLPPMSYMQDQARVNPQSASTFFADGRTMRLPVAGTVARGHLPTGTLAPEEMATLPNPLPRSAEVLQQGRLGYTNHCAVCHGALGDGVPTLTAAYGAKPANLQAKPFLDYSDGQLYGAIVQGKNAMPSYATHLDEPERWAVVHYLRALQRARNATDEDLKGKGGAR